MVKSTQYCIVSYNIGYCFTALTRKIKTLDSSGLYQDILGGNRFDIHYWSHYAHDGKTHHKAIIGKLEVETIVKFN